MAVNWTKVFSIVAGLAAVNTTLEVQGAIPPKFHVPISVGLNTALYFVASVINPQAKPPFLTPDPTPEKNKTKTD